MSNFCENEERRIDKFSRFQLSNSFRRIGWIIILISVVLLLINRTIIVDPYTQLVLRHIVLNTMIIGLLMISLAKEKIEDELIVSLRAKSYRMAFIFGVLYSLVQPYTVLVIRSLKESEPTDSTNTFSYFQVIIFMLIVQIAFFERFKRSH